MTDFPPKNRRATDLGVIDIEIAGCDARVRLDPNGLVARILDGDLFEGLGEPLPAESGVSVVSGRPGYLYADSDVEMVLEREEFVRFVERRLTPAEYFALRGHFGMFFMIHDDYYDEDTGQAVQPIPGVEIVHVICPRGPY